MDAQQPTLALLLRGDVHTLRAHAGEIAAWNAGLADLLAARGFPLRMYTGRPTAGRFAPAPWARAWRALGVGRLASLGLTTYPRLGQGAVPGDGLSLIWWRGLSHPRVAELDLFARFGPPKRLAERELADRCREIAERSGLSVGLLLSPEPRRGRLTRHTPLESAASGQGVCFGPRALRRYTWGLGWALWLTDGHLEALGGRARVLRAAPAARVVESPAGLWLEAAASPWEMTEERWARLEAFFAPILPSPQAVAALDPPRLPVAPEPTTQADAYAAYTGPPAPHAWLATVDVSLAINVHLARRPPAEAARALARAVRAWYLDGVGPEDEYVSGAWGGSFHFLHGPSWEGRVARWSLEAGGADAEAATRDLLRRLGGWSQRWGCPISVVRLGTEEP